MRVCRNCETALIPKDKNLVCLKCHTAYLDLFFLRTYFREIDFHKLVTESKLAHSKSSQNCLLCKKQMALHFIGQNIQVESCYPCQKVWFDTEEIKKFQKYTQLRNDGIIITAEKEHSLIPFTQYLFHSTLDNNYFYPGRQTLIETGIGEAVVNYTGNKITDSSFFKKYPVFTFALAVAVICGIAYCRNH